MTCRKLYSVKHGINFLIDSLTIKTDKVIFIRAGRMLIKQLPQHNRIDLNFKRKFNKTFKTRSRSLN